MAAVSGRHAPTDQDTANDSDDKPACSPRHGVTLTMAAIHVKTPTVCTITGDRIG